ncbi:metal-dependent hydrolase [Chryseobacterium shandongense]|uniref:metal-dependent hydrolase n=1 Tax=Chryseobacterium shandongense TaxID=1493872 RepID=UPI000F5048B9|nr:metal-dependent hydrolase [Chryseobacterium shandongense]AZA56950.1 metal-dependent hydrolase [Chryseobacterium shandongense]
MDSLTQIVLGAAVGEAVLGKKVGNKAMLYGAIAGTIPDLDVLSGYFTDVVTAIEWHRGFSHSIFFAVFFAPVFGWLIHKLERKQPAKWRDWTRLMFWGLFTHPILDTFTTWGTQLFWPFDHKLAFQSVFVIDPLYTLPFLFFLILAMCQKRGSAKRARYNRLGLIVSSSYLGITLLLKGVAYHKVSENLEAQGIAYRKMTVRPSPFNTILWSANIDAGDAYLIGNYSFFDRQPIQFTRYLKNHQLLGNLSGNEKVQRLEKITEGWFTIDDKNGDLFFNDLRFGLMSLDTGEDRFVFSYKLRPTGHGLEVEETPRQKMDAKRLLLALWGRMWGI